MSDFAYEVQTDLASIPNVRKVFKVNKKTGHAECIRTDAVQVVQEKTMPPLPDDIQKLIDDTAL